jgi:hypothetical protein
MAKHDPSKLPLAALVKFTENGREMKLGEGFWKTAGSATYRLYDLDPQSGDAAVQAVVPENGELDTFFVRLKLKAKKIAEAETLVCRKGQAGFFAPDKMTTAPALYNQLLPESEDRPRAADQTSQRLFHRYSNRRHSGLQGRAAGRRHESF